MSDFHLIRPWVLLFLIPILLLTWRVWKSGAGDSQWHEVIDPTLLKHLLDRPEGVSRRWPVVGLSFILSLLVVAAAGPAWQQLPQQVEQKEDALIIVLDLSLSMRATDIKPSRIQRAQHKLRDILNARQEGLTALVVYAGDAHTVAPFTDDADTIEAMVTSLLPEIMPKLGSRPDLGISQAKTLMRDGGIVEARLLLVSDELQERDINLIEQQIGNNIALSIMSVGTAVGGPIQLPKGGFFKNDDGTIVIPKLDPSNFRSLARKTGARYSTLQINNQDIDYLIKPGLELDRQTRASDREFDVWQDMGPWLVLLCLPFTLLAFRKGWLIVLVAGVCLTQPQPAMAFEWSDLWLTKDQQAQRQLQNGDPSTAASKFKSPAWKGTAHYKAGEYKEAAQEFSDLQNSNDYYNKGNALAKAGELKQASEAYAKSLELAPDDSDTQFNKALVDKLLEQQQQQQQEQEEQDQNQDQDQQQDQSEQSSEQQDQEQQDQEQQSSEEESESESESKQSENEQEESESEQQQAEQEAEEGEQSDQEQQAEMMAEAELTDEELDEAEQALEQWLRKVPDDPGGLLRQKFRYQSEQNKQNREYVDGQSKIW